MAEYIDKAQVQTELMMSAERYTVAHESNGFGKVEWSNNLIPVSKAMEIIRSMPSVDAVPVVRCEHCAHKKNCQWYYYSGDDYGFCNWAVKEEHEQTDKERKDNE